jgi:tetratricopeptide (TPR) repeat protein
MDARTVIGSGGALAAAFVAVAIVFNQSGSSLPRGAHPASDDPPNGVTRSGQAFGDAFDRALKLQKKGRLNEAIAGYRLLLEHQPDHVLVRYSLGYALMSKQECGLAIAEFERVLALDPHRHDAHLQIAKCARSAGDDSVAALHQSRWDESRRR